MFMETEFGYNSSTFEHITHINKNKYLVIEELKNIGQIKKETWQILLKIERVVILKWMSTKTLNFQESIHFNVSLRNWYS